MIKNGQFHSSIHYSHEGNVLELKVKQLRQSLFFSPLKLDLSGVN